MDRLSVTIICEQRGSSSSWSKDEYSRKSGVDCWTADKSASACQNLSRQLSDDSASSPLCQNILGHPTRWLLKKTVRNSFDAGRMLDLVSRVRLDKLDKIHILNTNQYVYSCVKSGLKQKRKFIVWDSGFRNLLSHGSKVNQSAIQMEPLNIVISPRI